MMQLNAWGRSWGDAWGDSWGEDEVEELGLATSRPPLVDFIVPPSYLRLVEVYRKTAELPSQETVDRSELDEMAEIYELFTKSPTRMPIWPRA